MYSKYFFTIFTLLPVSPFFKEITIKLYTCVVLLKPDSLGIYYILLTDLTVESIPFVRTTIICRHNKPTDYCTSINLRLCSLEAPAWLSRGQI